MFVYFSACTFGKWIFTPTTRSSWDTDWQHMGNCLQWWLWCRSYLWNARIQQVRFHQSFHLIVLLITGILISVLHSSLITRSRLCTTTGVTNLWYVLSCLWDDAYKRTLAVNSKEEPMWQQPVSSLPIWVVLYHLQFWLMIAGSLIILYLANL